MNLNDIKNSLLSSLMLKKNNVKGSRLNGFMVKNRDKVAPYPTTDGSIVWELYHPHHSQMTDVSIAEAYVEGGTETKLHVHNIAQEIYYILDGEGTMTLSNRRIDIRTGDAVLIPSGTSHKVKAGGSGVRILCVSTPPYEHKDTGLVGV